MSNENNIVIAFDKDIELSTDNTFEKFNDVMDNVREFQNSLLKEVDLKKNIIDKANEFNLMLCPIDDSDEELDEELDEEMDMDDYRNIDMVELSDNIKKEFDVFIRNIKKMNRRVNRIPYKMVRGEKVFTNKYGDTYVYEGDMSDGKPNGKGMAHYVNSKAKYWGGFKNGEHHGYGMLLYSEDNELLLKQGAWYSDVKSYNFIGYQIKLSESWYIIHGRQNMRCESPYGTVETCTKRKHGLVECFVANSVNGQFIGMYSKHVRRYSTYYSFSGTHSQLTIKYKNGLILIFQGLRYDDLTKELSSKKNWFEKVRFDGVNVTYPNGDKYSGAIKPMKSFSDPIIKCGHGYRSSYTYHDGVKLVDRGREWNEDIFIYSSKSKRVLWKDGNLYYGQYNWSTGFVYDGGVGVEIKDKYKGRLEENKAFVGVDGVCEEEGNDGWSCDKLFELGNDPTNKDAVGKRKNVKHKMVVTENWSFLTDEDRYIFQLYKYILENQLFDKEEIILDDKLREFFQLDITDKVTFHNLMEHFTKVAMNYLVKVENLPRKKRKKKGGKGKEITNKQKTK
jgi:hypothetical protein